MKKWVNSPAQGHPLTDSGYAHSARFRSIPCHSGFLLTLEKGKVGTLDRYVMRPDGKMDNIFLFRRGNLAAPLEQWKGVAWVHNRETNAEWRVQFMWPIRLPYLIIDLDPNYQWSVVGYPNRKLAWVLSRKPVLDEATYQAILKRMTAQGYQPTTLAKVPQITESVSPSR